MLTSLCVACTTNSSTNLVPPPTGSPSPPFIGEHGTLAVVDVSDSKAKKVRLFRPHSDQQFAQIVSHGDNIQLNSVTFDRRGHIYVGSNDTKFPGEYSVSEFKVSNLDRIREIRGLPGWNRSSVVTDDENYLYVNTKAFLGGDIKIYKPNVDRKPDLEIKDTGNPVTTLAAGGTLWVASEVAHGAFLDGYELRSRKSKFSHSLKGVDAARIAVNNDASLAAVFLRNFLSPEFAVNIFSANTGFLRQIIKGKNLKAMAGDSANTLYVSESDPGRVFRCDFQHCPVYFATNSNNPGALAVDKRNGNFMLPTVTPATSRFIVPAKAIRFSPLPRRTSSRRRLPSNRKEYRLLSFSNRLITPSNPAKPDAVAAQAADFARGAGVRGLGWITPSRFAPRVLNAASDGRDLFIDRYSRAQEESADLKGAALGARAGFNPWGMVGGFASSLALYGPC